jgi:DNA-binding transcriptional regulator/RsmH inhibitor MraZ
MFLGNHAVALSVKKSLKIPKGYSESINRRRTDNTITKTKSTKGQTTIYKT